MMKQPRILASVLVVCAVMVGMAVPGFMNVAATDPPYEGDPLLWLNIGNNIEQTFSQVYTDSSYSYEITALWLMQHVQDANNQYNVGQLIDSVSRWDVSTQKWKTYVYGMPPSQNFKIWGSSSYLIHCKAVQGYTAPYHVWITDATCPTQATALVHAGKYSLLGTFRTGIPEPMTYPPDPALYVQTYASEYWGMLRNMDLTPYTGTGTIACFNSETQQWQTYIAGVPPSDFVVNWWWLYDGMTLTGGLGGHYHTGLMFYVSQDGVMPNYHTEWPAWD